MLNLNKNQLNLIATVIDCEHKTAPVQDEGIPSIRTPNVGNGRLILENVRRVSAETYQKWTKRAIPAYPDLILAREAPVGNVALVPKNLKVCLGQRTVLIRPDTNKVCPEYLNFLLNSMKSNLVALSNGSTVGHLNVEDIRNLELPKLPPLPTQKKIAAVLSAYDDLIENNTRRIALLERMAEELYKEWFVRMRFLGHEQTRFVKGIPEGWEAIKVDDAFKFTGGGTPSKDSPNYWKDGKIDWYTPSDLTSSKSMFAFESELKCNDEGLSSSSAKLFPAYSIMMTSRATIGVIAINTTPACTNQGFITCFPNDDFPLFYLYSWLKLSKENFLMVSTGATFPELTKGTFKKVMIMKPFKPVLDQFQTAVAPMYQQIESLLKKNQNIKQTRDRLLTRLISGKLSVEELDMAFPPSMLEDEIVQVALAQMPAKSDVIIGSGQ